MPNAIEVVDRAISLAERIAAGKVKLSTIRKVSSDTAMMVLLWFHYQIPEGINALDFEVSEILFERLHFGRMTKSDKTRQ